ncbi:MAG: hypothetical protein ACTSYU_07425, partial [Promethearchaeota archaeon]
PLHSMLERHENAKMTINIQGCLVDQLNGLDLKHVGQRLNRMMQLKRVDLVGTAKYHPILPLIPKSEILRQIDLNTKTMQKNFDGSWQPKGFFPPEMAVSNELISTVGKLGYKWIIMDGIAHKEGEWPQNYVQQVQPVAGSEDSGDPGICVVFRDSYISNMISFKNIDAKGFINQLLSMFPDGDKEDYYVITAMDAETFGHHIKFYETSFLGKVFSLIEDYPEIQTTFISDIVEKFPKKIQPAGNINASSWSTDKGDLVADVPYPLWSHPENPVHKYQFRLLNALYKLMELLEAQIKVRNSTPKVSPKNFSSADNLSPNKSSSEEKSTDDHYLEYYRTARYFYDESLHSCWLWWASMRPMWSPNLIYKGLDLINRTALNAQLALINLQNGQGDEFYSIVIDNGEKIMGEIMEQELAGRRVRTFGDFAD